MKPGLTLRLTREIKPIANYRIKLILHANSHTNNESINAGKME